MANMIKVRSASDFTLVINAPEIPLVKTWNKRGAIYPIDNDVLIQAFYSTSLEELVRKGLLIIEDKQFLIEVGLAEEESTVMAIELTPALKEKCISTMPVWELEQTLGKMSEYQISELAEYAIANHTKMKMDRIELLGKASHKNILKAIELYKAAQED
jgi:hypothetical protein